MHTRFETKCVSVVCQLGLEIRPRDPGVWEISGALFLLFVLETDLLAEAGETALALFSRVFLRHPHDIIERWRATGHADLLHFVIQQIEQFKRIGEEFVMQPTDVDVMNQTWAELQAHVLETAPIEKRLHGLAASEIANALDRKELEELARAVQERLAAEKNSNGEGNPQ